MSIGGFGFLQFIKEYFGVSNAGNIGALGVARFEFDTAVAANKLVAAHGVDVNIPANSMIVGGFIDVNTAFTSGTSAAEIAIHVEGANDIIAAAAVSGAPYSSINRKAIVPKANTPESTSVKTTVIREITCTVTVEVLTAGKLTGYLYFVNGDVSA